MKKRLLIVEDTELDRDLLVQIFEDLYDLELAEDGESAVDAASRRSPDLVLMDIGLPGLSGRSTLPARRRRRLRRRCCSPRRSGRRRSRTAARG